MLTGMPDPIMLHLATLADRAINNSLGRAVKKGKLYEVPAVEALVVDGLRDVAARWRRSKLLPLPPMALQTVFCHAAPKVSFTRPAGGKGCCELADLLLVIDDLNATVPTERRRAVLVQAKMHKPPSHLHLNNGNERVQFELLSGWPAFTFNAGFYRPHFRDLNLGPALPSYGGEYGGIDQPPGVGWTQYLIGSPTFATAAPVVGAVSLGQLLSGMLAGRDGYGRPTVPYGRDAWSETIQELLDVTFKLPIRRRQPSTRRGRHLPLNFNLVGGSETVWPPGQTSHGKSPPHDYEEDDEWPDGAISVARFVIGEGEGEG